MPEESSTALSLSVALCLIGCAVTLAGTPAVYLACVGVCTLAVSTAPTFIVLDACSVELESATEAAMQSYCSCLEWQEGNCPDGAETDLVGCP